MTLALTSARPDGDHDGIGALEARATAVRLFGRVFAVVMLAAMVGWPFCERLFPESTQLTIDVIIPIVVVAGAFALATYSRRTHVRSEQAKLALAEARARLDELSGLYNVRHLREEVRSAVAEAARSGGRFALITMDLDNFKEFNDRLGHGAGDELIAAVGRAIADELPEGAMGARPAGDEFAVLVPDADRSRAEHVAAAMARSIARASVRATPLNAHLAVSASFGIAAYPDDASDAESLTAAAERAMHRAKADVLDEHARRTERSSEDVFFAIGDAISRSLDPREVLNNLCEAVARCLGLDVCAIWRVDRDAAMRPHAWYVADPSMTERFQEVLSIDPMSQQEAVEAGLLQKRSSYTDDLALRQWLPERYAQLMEPGIWLVSVPLAIGAGGALLMAAKHERSAPPQPGLEVAIGRMVDAALSNAETFARATRQAEHLSELAGLGGLLFSDGPFEERLASVARRIGEVTGYESVTIDTADPTGQQPFCRSYYGRRSDGSDFPREQIARWLTLRPALEEASVVEFLSQMTKPMLMRDPAGESSGETAEILRASGIRTAAVVPVTWRDELKGLLYFGATREGAYDDRDMAMMQSIAAQLAPSLQVASLHVELAHSYGELKDAHLHALLRLAYAAEARDPYTECHLQRIRALAQAVAKRMGIGGEELEALGYGAIVHDLGKLRIPDSILMNPGALSDDEWAQMKRHPEWGAEIIGTNAFYDIAREVALSHHERWDGSGYPRGLKGDEIPLAARIVSVADVYDALTSARPYKAAWAAERALVELMRMRGKTLCPQSVDVFMELWREGEVTRIDEETLDDSLEVDFRSFYAAAA